MRDEANRHATPRQQRLAVGAEGRLRARRARGQHAIAITDTVGINADGTFPKTAGEQTRRALAIIRAAIEALGGRLEDVVRTRGERAGSGWGSRL